MPGRWLLPALLGTCMLAQGPGPNGLLDQIHTHSELQRNLEELCDGIGPRLTGSEHLRRAQRWAMDKLRAYGAVNVHLEPYVLGRPWHRGSARARLLNASGIDLVLAQWGWTEGTHGKVRGDVALLEVATLAEFEAVIPRLAGKIVLVKARPRMTEAEGRDPEGFRSRLRRAWRAAPFPLVLIPSGKEEGLTDMAGGPDGVYGSRTAFISAEHAALLQRLISRGVIPRLEAELGGRFEARPIQDANVVAEIPGSDHPEEVVILGAHLDAWDLGCGATDNGAGVAAFLEVVRAIGAGGLQPKRTLRVVLFSGEEQGLLGSRAYLAAHAAEASRIQAVLVMDAGAGRITAFADGQVDAWAEILQAILKPAEVLGPVDVVYARPLGSDQETFRRAGIPAFLPKQEDLDYRTRTQHTRLDTVSHVLEADLIQAAQILATVTWGLLNGPRLPHVPPDSGPSR